MALKKIKNSILLVALFSVLWLTPNYSSALEQSEVNSNTVVDSKSDENLTIGDIEKIFQEYLQENNIDIKVGTTEYLDYMYDQLLENKDKKLLEHPKYKLIASYFTEYIIGAQDNYFNNEINNEGNQKVKRSLKQANYVYLENRDKTISEIREETIQEDEAIQENEAIQQKSENIRGIKRNAVSGYSPSLAKKYATTWAYHFNPFYSQYRYDCTNYVSQCLQAGGVKMKKPSSVPGGIYETSKYWYAHDKSRVSTPWLRVTDFHSYWAPIVRDANYKDSSSVSKNGNIGDVVMFRDAGTLKRWHTMIITSKGNNNVVYLSGHTTARLNYPITNYNDSTIDWSLLDF